MKITILDVETSGLDPAADDVIEIASMDLLESGDGWTRMAVESHFVHTELRIPPEVSAVHHIVNRDLESAPRLADVLPLHTGGDIFVAHHAEFDASFLPQISGPWLCTWKCSLRHWPQAPGFGNQTLRYWLGLIEIPGVDRRFMMPHRAANDVRVTAEILLELLKHQDVNTLEAWSNDVARPPYVDFGKHQGTAWADVPKGYLSWMLGQDFEEYRRAAADRELQRRRGR